MELYQINISKISSYLDNNQDKITGISLEDSFDKLNIDESIEEHLTQIIFILKESFFENGNFSGWKEFTRKYLEEQINKDLSIYHNNFNNGTEFTKEFPEKLDYFLDTFCTKRIVDNSNQQKIFNTFNTSNLSLKQREQLGIHYSF